MGLQHVHRPDARGVPDALLYSALGPPQRSHPCIECYPHSATAGVGCGYGTITDRRYQLIADAQSGLTVYVTGAPLLPRARGSPGRHDPALGSPQRCPILTLRATHSASSGCGPWIWEAHRTSMPIVGRLSWSLPAPPPGLPERGVCTISSTAA